MITLLLASTAQAAWPYDYVVDATTDPVAVAYGPAALACPSCSGNVDVAYLPNASGTVVFKNKLFVFLPGGGTPASAHDKVVQTAAFAGYHAISLNYANTGTWQPNDPATCSRAFPGFQQARQCYAMARERVILGAPGLSTDSTILPRLAQQLDDLHTAASTDGWDTFYDPATGDLILDHIVFGGFSNGAGMAYDIARRFPQVPGIVLIDGTKDPWESATDLSLTDARFYCYAAGAAFVCNAPYEPTSATPFALISEQSTQWQMLEVQLQDLGTGAAVDAGFNPQFWPGDGDLFKTNQCATGNHHNGMAIDRHMPPAATPDCCDSTCTPAWQDFVLFPELVYALDHAG